MEVYKENAFQTQIQLSIQNICKLSFKQRHLSKCKLTFKNLLNLINIYLNKLYRKSSKNKKGDLLNN